MILMLQASEAVSDADQDSNLEAVVLIVTDYGSSTGFIAEQAGEKHIYTTLGCIEATSLLRFRTLGGIELEPIRLEASPNQDIARVAFKESSGWTSFFRFSDKAPSVGESVNILGSASSEYVASKNSAKITGIGPSLFSFSGPAKEGNRGAPILDSKGTVIGVFAYYGTVDNDGSSEKQIAATGHSAIRSDEIVSLRWIDVSPHKLTIQTQLLSDLRTVRQHLSEIAPFMGTKKSTTQERVYTRIFETRSKEWTEIGYKESNRSLFHDLKWFALLKSLCDSHDKVIEMRYRKAVALRSHSTQTIMREFMNSMMTLETEPPRLLKQTNWVLPFYGDQAEMLNQEWVEAADMIREIRDHFQGNWD